MAKKWRTSEEKEKAQFFWWGLGAFIIVALASDGGHIEVPMNTRENPLTARDRKQNALAARSIFFPVLPEG